MSLSTLGVDQLKSGPITAKKLKRLKIKSPEETNGVRINHNTVVYTKRKFRSEASKQKYIEMKKQQLNLI